MFKLTPLVLLFFLLNAHAFTCMDYTGKTIQNTSQDYTFIVPVAMESQGDEVTLLNLNDYFKCRNDAPNQRTDLIDFGADGVTTVLDASVFKMEGYINGANVGDLASLVGRNILTLKDNNFHPLPINIRYKLSDELGKLVSIHTGDTLAVIDLLFHSTPKGGDYEYHLKLIAANDMHFTSGGCDINNGNTISIDFGQTDSGAIRRNEVLPKQISVPVLCNKSMNLPVSLTLDGTSSIFDPGAISMGDEDLAVEIYKDKKKISAGSSVQEDIINGAGSIDLEFKLASSGKEIEPGLYKGSAVLIISAQ